MRCFLKLFLFTLVLAHTSVAVAQTTPEELDRNVKAATSELYSQAALWGATFVAEYNGEQNYGKLRKIRKELSSYIDEQIAIFKTPEQVGGSETYLKAVLDFFKYEKTLVENYFGPFESLNASSEDKVQTCRGNLTAEAAKEKDYTAALNSARTAYAAKNNFSIAPSLERDAPRPIVKRRVVAKKPQPAASEAEAPEPPKKPGKIMVDDESDDDESDDETAKKPERKKN